MSKDTFCPSFRLRIPAASTAVACTNTSLPPPSGEIKPKPLEVLKNFTVPMVIAISLSHRIPHARHARADAGNENISLKKSSVWFRPRNEAGRNQQELRLTD